MIEGDDELASRLELDENEKSSSSTGNGMENETGLDRNAALAACVIPFYEKRCIGIGKKSRERRSIKEAFRL